MRPLLLALLFSAVLDPVLARADVTLSSSVGGYCRIGKYTPVAITPSDASEVLIEADGALPVQIRAGAGATLVVPLLTVAPPSGMVRLRSAGSTRAVALPVRVLSENEKLVGQIGSVNAEEVHFLFPDKQIIPVPLDPSRPLPGTRAAWEVLDAVIGGTGPIPCLDDAALRALLGSGIALAVRSPQPPDDRWPWHQRGAWWVLQHDPLGPTTALMESAAAPVRAWPPATSLRAPALVVGCGLLMLLGAWTAWRGRQRFIRGSGASVFTLALIGVVLGSWQRPPAQHQAEGTVACFSEGLLQHDFWEYCSPARTDGAVSCACLLDTRQPREKWSRVATRPMLRSAAQASRLQLTLEVDAWGEPQQWTARLPPGEKLAFLTRLVDPFPYTPPLAARISWHPTATDSPLHALVRAAYLAPGVRVVGQGHPRTDTKDGFAEVFLERER